MSLTNQLHFCSSSIFQKLARVLHFLTGPFYSRLVTSFLNRIAQFFENSPGWLIFWPGDSIFAQVAHFLKNLPEHFISWVGSSIFEKFIWVPHFLTKQLHFFSSTFFHDQAAQVFKNFPEHLISWWSLNFKKINQGVSFLDHVVPFLFESLVSRPGGSTIARAPHFLTRWLDFQIFAWNHHFLTKWLCLLCTKVPYFSIR